MAKVSIDVVDYEYTEEVIRGESPMPEFESSDKNSVVSWLKVVKLEKLKIMMYKHQ
ncbi:hypothetical protein [Escherichia phage OLB35]|uniref:Uncharacterized 8.8 kDa protein in frd-Gp32 intergenic region n=1 Tax=Escherichia phage OLB35 TaxID=2448911 RepID=A0A3G3MC34_9CAUD|nr:hypothetical protein [Escherichia phage OLB35]